MIVIVDYEAGNLASVERAVRRLGYETLVTGDPQAVRQAERVIFPGVGAAGSAMASLTRGGLDQALRDVRDQGTPLMGICLGAQIIFEDSEEDGGTRCLGLLPGTVRRFPLDHAENETRLKVPHMGWNTVAPARGHPVLAGIEPEHQFYFVHSYYPDPSDDSHVLGRTTYGLPFASIVGQGNLIACQFHLEKSGQPGLNVLDAFLRWVPHA